MAGLLLLAGRQSRSRWPGAERGVAGDAAGPGLDLGPVAEVATRAQARARVAEWIEEYNTARRHSAIAMMSPVGFELAQARNEAA